MGKTDKECPLRVVLDPLATPEAMALGLLIPYTSRPLSTRKSRVARTMTPQQKTVYLIVSEFKILNLKPIGVLSMFATDNYFCFAISRFDESYKTYY